MPRQALMTYAWQNAFGKYMEVRQEGMFGVSRIYWTDNLEDATLLPGIHMVPREVRKQVKPVRVREHLVRTVTIVEQF